MQNTHQIKRLKHHDGKITIDPETMANLLAEQAFRNEKQKKKRHK
jgi:hypothetical protein